jgi:hypothetical protein
VCIPSAIPERLRSPGLPPCWLSLSVQGAVVKAEFEVEPVLTAFVEAFAKKLKKRHDVRMGSAPLNTGPCAEVRVVRIDAGSRMLRYMLTFFAGKTCFEAAGSITGPTGQRCPFHFQHKCIGGFFGGSSLNLLKLDAANVANRVAKAVLKASR